MGKDDTPFWSCVRASTIDHPECGKVWVAVHSDVTERKRADEALAWTLLNPSPDEC